MTVYFNGFNNWQDVCRKFCMNEPKPDEVLYANYDNDLYDGDAEVIYRNGDNYYIVSASHCSCYGLSGLWEPEEFFGKEFFVTYLERTKKFPQILKILKSL